MGALPTLLRIAWRNVRRHVRHSRGSFLAIAVGFFAIAMFDGYMTWMMVDYSDFIADGFMLGDLIVEAPGASDAKDGTAGKLMLGEREQAFLDEYLASRSGEVVSRMRQLYTWGVANAGKSSAGFIGFGYDVKEGAVFRRRLAWNAIAGRPLQLAPESSALLGVSLGALLECEPGTAAPWKESDGTPIPEERPLACRRSRIQLTGMTESGQINVVQPEVVGLFDGSTKDMDVKVVQMPLPLAQKLRDTTGVSFVSVLLRDRSAAAAFSRDLVRAARERGIALVAMPWREHASGLEARRGMAILSAFRGLMSIVVVVIAGMAVLTTMAKAVSERTREIGTLRSLGFLRRHVVALFALESGLLAATACLVGIAATVAATAAANAAGVTYEAGLFAQPIPLIVRYMPRTWAVSAALLAGIAALAAVVPARRAARTRIPDALTHA